MACDNCDCKKSAMEKLQDQRKEENPNEIDMTHVWTSARVPESGNARATGARTSTTEECPGITSENCCQATQPVPK